MQTKCKQEINRVVKLPSDGDISGRRFGEKELRLLREVISSGTLWGVRGTMVKRFEKEFANKYGISYCIATSSGTAAIHTALAAINPEPGDEIITTPITDMGAITPILFQNAIPIFADVDPLTLNIAAHTIKPKITKKTKAIIVTHLFGYPCDMDEIISLAKEYKIPIIEDACQAYGAEYKGKKIGTIGDIGCFSLQQGKHIATGEGGLIITNNENYAKRMRLFVNKAWGYDEPNPDHYFLALNYRMTELQGAVGIAQLEKLDIIIKRRIEMANLLTQELSHLKGITIPPIVKGAVHTYWRYTIRLEDNLIKFDITDIAKRLKEKGIHCIARYIQKPAFMCEIFKDKRTYGSSRCPFACPLRNDRDEIQYRPEDYPGAINGLKHILVFPWNDLYTEEHVRYIANTIKKIVTD